MSLFTEIPSNYKILFLDMDAFFASCEQEMRPELRNKPVGVVPQIIDSTCIVSPSYEAKRLGIKTGTNVREAKIKCPNIHLVEARPKLYKEVHYKVADILKSVSPWVDAKSVDEFSVLISPSERNASTALRLSNHIKTIITRNVGAYTTASIGFGPNQFLAKIASEMNKPNGTGVITLENLHNTLGKMELTDLPGIAHGMSRQLRGHNIYTNEQLLATNAQTLRRYFGFLGEVWWYRLHGYEVDDIEHKRSTIGHSHVLAPEWRTPAKAYHVLQRLVHKAGQRLRTEGYLASHTHLVIRYTGHQSYYNHIRTRCYCDSHTAIQLAQELFQNRPIPLQPILQFAFSFSSLVKSNSVPQSLFPEYEKPIQLTRALDIINDKYGRDTISVASALDASDTAPDRIPFGKIRY